MSSFAFTNSLGLKLAFVISLHGCALLILGALCLVVRWPATKERDAQDLPWRWLGAFGLFKGIGIVAMAVLGSVDRTLAPETMRAIYASGAWPADGALMAMALAAWRPDWRIGRRGWGLVVSWVVFGVAGGVAAWRGEATGWLRAIGPVAAVSLAMPLGAQCRGEWQGGRLRRIGAIGLGGCALGLLGLGLLEGQGAAYADRFQGWTVNTNADFEHFRLGNMLHGAVAAWLALLGWWVWARARVARVIRRGARSAAGRALWMLPLGFVALVAAGFSFMSKVNHVASDRIGEQLFIRARLLAVQFGPDARRLLAHDPATRRMVEERLAWAERLADDIELIAIWTAGTDRLEVLAASNPRVPWLERPSGRRGLRDERFWGDQAFESGTQSDRVGQFHVRSVPLYDEAGRPTGAWIGLRNSQQSWDREKLPVMGQASLSIVLVALLGIAVVVYLIQRDLGLELRLARERAEAESRAKSEFLAFMSHELRTPLQSVLGYTELMRAASHPAEQEVPLAAVHAQGALLLRMINDLLDFSAVEVGRLRLERAPFALRAVVEECALAVEPLARAKGLEVVSRVEVAAGGEWLCGDAQRLKQILLNLLGNAVKFSSRGHVEVTARVRPPPPESQTPAWECVLSVRDMGPGIAPADQARLFRPFARLNQPAGSTAPGAGLGLALVRRLCELMDGRVDCESVPGAGATFTVRVALPTAEPGTTPVPVHAAPPALGPVRVLVVEDNELIRELLVLFLRSLGCAPTAVGDGAAAVAAFGREAFPLVVMDLRMPGELDGLAATRAIRRIAPSADWPWIVGCSASLLADERDQCRAAGMQAFLAKPVSRAELAAALAACPWSGAVAGDAAQVAAAGARPTLSAFQDVRLNLDAAAAARLAETFHVDTPVRIAALRKAVADADRTAIIGAAHYLKNTGHFFGAAELVDACARCEAAARAGQIDAAALARIEHELARLGGQLKQTP